VNDCTSYHSLLPPVFHRSCLWVLSVSYLPGPLGTCLQAAWAVLGMPSVITSRKQVSALHFQFQCLNQPQSRPCPHHSILHGLESHHLEFPFLVLNRIAVKVTLESKRWSDDILKDFPGETIIEKSSCESQNTGHRQTVSGVHASKSHCSAQVTQHGIRGWEQRK
jgi:hypothetical protein